jgi:hypothetical protein
MVKDPDPLTRYDAIVPGIPAGPPIVYVPPRDTAAPNNEVASVTMPGPKVKVVPPAAPVNTTSVRPTKFTESAFAGVAATKVPSTNIARHLITAFLI